MKNRKRTEGHEVDGKEETDEEKEVEGDRK